MRAASASLGQVRAPRSELGSRDASPLLQILVEPAEQPGERVDAVPALAETVALARIDDVLHRHLLPLERRVQLVALRLRDAVVLLPLQDQRRRLRVREVAVRRALAAQV